MTELYIYYRVRDELADQLAPRVLAMQRGLSSRTGVQSRLKRRPQSKDGVQTWMEVYLATPIGFGAALEQAVSSAGLLASIEGDRHTEAFLDISPCV